MYIVWKLFRPIFDFTINSALFVKHLEVVETQCIMSLEKKNKQIQQPHKVQATILPLLKMALIPVKTNLPFQPILPAVQPDQSTEPRR